MIFITGGTGLIGAHLLFELLQKGEKVRAMKREHSNLDMVKHIFNYYVSTSESNEMFEQIDWVDGDILNIHTLLNLIEGVETVYHCAAIISFDPKDKVRMITDNVKGTANIVNACLEKKVKALCHVSSIAAIGRDQTNGIVTELNQWQHHPRISTYSISKYESEREVWRGTAEGLNAVIVNPSIILGPGNWENGSARLFSSVYNGLKFYTNGKTGFVDVRDVVKAMILLIESKVYAERFILNGDNLSYQELFSIIAKGLKVKGPHILAKKWMTELVWRLEAIKGFFVKNKPLITRETAFTANNQYNYSNEKLNHFTSFNYRPIQESIQDFTTMYLKDLNTNN